MWECKFCNKEHTSKRSVSAHQALCRLNPDGKSPKDWLAGVNKGMVPWNAGLVNDERCKHTDATKNKLSNKMKERSKEWHIENGKKISKTVKQKVEDGAWHTSLAKNLHISYNGCDLHGTWELKYAQYLDKNNIKWARNTQSFEYVFEGKVRRYIPDFYLLESKAFVEIKGYKTAKDEAKWAQFPEQETLHILMKDELSSLGVI